MNQQSIFDSQPEPEVAEFDGDTYEAEKDHRRLSGQVQRVYEAMRDGQWRTVQMISDLTGDPPASIQARLRDLRKERFGAYEVESHRSEPNGSIWVYRVGAKGEGTPVPIRTTINDLRAQLATVTAERDALQRQLNEIRRNGNG